MFASQKQGNLPVENIQRVVANYFNLSLVDMKGKKRNKGIVRARHYAMYLIRKMTEYSLTEIGEIFGGRDHTTVINALDKIESEIQTDTSLYSLLQELERIIKESGTKNG
jgi:chromosomal replication initiator protein